MSTPTEKAGKAGGRPRGLQSVDQAVTLLQAMAAEPGPLPLGSLAARAGMSPSKAHRYLASFVAGGLAVQEQRSGRYDLGPLTLDLGLAAIGRLQLVNRAADRMPDLVARTGATVLLAVWSPAGPVIVRWERPARFTVTALGLGSVLPLTRSATGQVFLAWLPAHLTAALLAADPPGEAVEGLVARIRREGLAKVDARLIPGLYAASVPVLNWQGEAEAALTLIGPEAGIIDLEGPCVEALRRAGEGASVTGPTGRPVTA